MTYEERVAEKLIEDAKQDVQNSLFRLAGLLEPDEVIEYVESISDSMRRELEETT